MGNFRLIFFDILKTKQCLFTMRFSRQTTVNFLWYAECKVRVYLLLNAENKLFLFSCDILKSSPSLFMMKCWEQVLLYFLWYPGSKPEFICSEILRTNSPLFSVIYEINSEYIYNEAAENKLFFISRDMLKGSPNIFTMKYWNHTRVYLLWYVKDKTEFIYYEMLKAS